MIIYNSFDFEGYLYSARWKWYFARNEISLEELWQFILLHHENVIVRFEQLNK